jgi:phenylalanyl-tRNA synthetase alpha chain
VQLAMALAKRDLSDPSQGLHAINIVVERVRKTLVDAWAITPHVYRRVPIVTVSENYDRLYYPDDAPARSELYARYLGVTAQPTPVSTMH